MVEKVIAQWSMKLRDVIFLKQVATEGAVLFCFVFVVFFFGLLPNFGVHHNHRKLHEKISPKN